MNRAHSFLAFAIIAGLAGVYNYSAYTHPVYDSQLFASAVCLILLMVATRFLLAFPGRIFILLVLVIIATTAITSYENNFAVTTVLANRAEKLGNFINVTVLLFKEENATALLIVATVVLFTDVVISQMYGAKSSVVNATTNAVSKPSTAASKPAAGASKPAVGAANLKATHRLTRGDNGEICWIPDTLTGTHRQIFDNDGTVRYVLV
jgi:hypothetical protein